MSCEEVDFILNSFEEDGDEILLKERIEEASDEILWGQFGIFYYLSEGDNGLPQLLKINWKLRHDLLCIIMFKKLESEKK